MTPRAHPRRRRVAGVGVLLAGCLLLGGRPGRVVRAGAATGGGGTGGDRRARRLAARSGRVLPAPGAAAGDRIVVGLDGGGTRSFLVERVERQPKEDLPVGRIWNRTDRSVLRLITCGGSFDRGSGHYRDNIMSTPPLLDTVI
jgi:hypothetical protein